MIEPARDSRQSQFSKAGEGQVKASASVAL